MASASRIIKSVLDRFVVRPSRRLPALRRLAGYLARAVSEEGYPELRERFIANGDHCRWSRGDRIAVVKRFERVDENVEIGSTPAEGLIMAEALLNLNVPGDVIECGCFAGGSTAKLSIVAKMMGKELSVFDSFEGLPEVDSFNKKDFNARQGADWVTEWSAGRYAARLDTVRANVGRYGEIDICSFKKGWFEQTLTPEAIPGQIAMAFVDVDVSLSARQCFVPLWPRIVDGGVFFLHDVGFIKLIQGILDEKLWTEHFKEHPPILFGAGFGLGDRAPYLGFMVKGRDVSAEYINGLTVFK